MKVTLGRNKITGDRSFCEMVFELVATNSTHTQLRVLGEHFPFKAGRIVTVLNDEYDMSDAANFEVEKTA